MSATELDEVQALLEHVLPDPTGYAQRLAMQFMTRWGQSARSADGAPFPSAPAHDVPQSEIITTPDESYLDELPVDTNLLLAAALGACECWGLRADCESCRGDGSSGWTQPHPELFEELVRPALERLPDGFVGDRNPDGGLKAREGRHHHPTAQGVNP